MRLGGTILALSLAVVGCDGGGDAGVDADPPGRDAGDAAARDGSTGGDAGDAAVGCGSLAPPSLTYEDVVAGYDWSANQLVGVVQAPGADDLYVLDQRGQILLVRDGAVLPRPFLELPVDYSPADNERGLLGLAFHPDYADNGRFFVYYTATESGGYRNILAELRRSSADPDVADPTEVRRLIDVDDPDSNHNGGQLAFGADRYLYVGMGDGGSENDEGDGHDPLRGNGQSTSTYMGKIHRLDVDATSASFAAPGNPFSSGGGLPTIWAYGLRNPWRFSFDRATHDLWIADVGQAEWEELDFQPASSSGGENYGWAAFEGTHPFRTDVPVPTDPVDPILEYSHSESTRDPSLFQGYVCAVVGGYVYRGSAIPSLRGWYLFGDYCSTDVVAMKRCDGHLAGTQRLEGLRGLVASLTSLGEDSGGELYLVGSHALVKIVPG